MRNLKYSHRARESKGASEGLGGGRKEILVKGYKLSVMTTF